jgi:hypothetical protein
MADENLELQQQMAQLSSQMQGLGSATDNAAQGVQSFGKTAYESGQATVKGLNNWTQSVGQGQTSIKGFNTLIDSTTGALGSMLSIIPFVGEGLNNVTKAIGSASKYMVSQLDEIATAFDHMGQVGALTADGMEGLTQQFLKSGLTLNQFVKQVNENSTALARFRGMTSKGADDFAEITGKLIDRTAGADDSMRRLGMGSEDIANTAAAFVTQQTRLGLAQKMTTEQIIDGTRKYAFELDALSKVTGLSRQAIQKQQDAALSEARFRASYDELIAQGKEKEAEALLNFQTQLSAVNADLGQGIRDLVSGAGTDAARRLSASTGGAAQVILDKLKDGTIDQYEAVIQLQGAVRGMIVPMRDTAKYVDAANSAFVNYAGVSDFEKAKFEKNGDEIRRIQKEQITTPEKKPGQVFDDLTTQVINSQKALESMGIEINKMSYTFLPAVGGAVASITWATEQFVKFVVRQLNPSQDEIDKRNKKSEENANPFLNIPQGDWEGRKRKNQNQPQINQSTPPTDNQSQSQPNTPNTRNASNSSQAPADPYAGLRIKSAESTAGGDVNAKLPEIARLIQEKLGGDLKYFSAFNDRHHMDTHSAHAKGNAMDFTLTDPTKAAAVAAQLMTIPGVSQVLDEYTTPSRGSTGGHIHAEISARNGAVLSGPTSGYQPNLAMHGTEAIVPLNPSVVQNLAGNKQDSELMREQLNRMDEMVTLLKNQLTVTTKLMQYSA